MKTRIKMHQFPGDVGVSVKVWMMEGRTKGPGVREWKKGYILIRERAVIRERTKAEVREALREQ